MASFAVFSPAQQLNTESFRGREAMAREVLVRFRRPEGFSARQSADLQLQTAQALDSEAMHPIGRHGAVRIRSRVWNVQALIDRLRQDPLVEWAEPNYILHATETLPNDNFFGSQYGLRNTGQTVNTQAGLPFADTGAAKAWDTTVGSASVAVGILDTGVDFNHGDLAGNVWTSTTPYDITIRGETFRCPAGSHGFNAYSMTCDPLDNNSHGSHVAGIIGATGNNDRGVSGVNWKTTIVPLKMLGQFGSGSEADAVDAIEAAIQLKALGVNIRVLNASWSGYASSTAMREAIADAEENDILFVAAAGNDGGLMETMPNYPAAYPLGNILSVAATDNRDQLAAFSTYSPLSVDLGAPGVDILSTFPANTYSYLSGTSMAAPHVAGAAALVLSACALNTTQLRDLLLQTVDIAPALVGRTVTGGRLNVSKAVNACTSAPKPDFTIGANPATMAVFAPGSAATTVTVSPLNGFNGAVKLEAFGLPSGVTAAFAPETVNGGPSQMTITASSNALPGQYQAVVRGTSGALTASAAVPIAVSAKDFTFSVSTPKLTLPLTGSTGATVSVAPVLGFTDAVDLSVDGVPSGVTARFQPPNITGGSGSSSFTLTASTSAIRGVYALTIRGISGGIVHSVPVELTTTGPLDFILAPATTQVTIGLSGSASLTIFSTVLNGFSGSVALSLFGLPPGITGAFQPSPLTAGQSTVLTLTAGASVPQGTYTITVQGVGGGLTRTTTFTLTVLPALPTITLSAPGTLKPGEQAQVAIFLSQGAPGGVTVDIANSSPWAGVLNTSSTFLPPNQTSTGKLRISGLAAGTVTLAATAPGYQPATVQIQVGYATAPLGITTLALTTGQTGVPYSQQLTAAGGVAPYRWTLVEGALPSGLTLSQGGLLTGAVATPVAGLPLTFRVTDSGVPAQTASATFALTIAAPATPASIAATGGTPQTALRNAPFALPLMATVFDGEGKPVQGVAVTFQAPAQGPSGAFTGGGKTFVATTNVNGLATAAFIANGETGSYAVTARVTGVATPAIFQLTNTAVALPGITLIMPPSVAVGGRAQVAVILAAPAPPGGLTLQLETSDPATAVLNQSTTFIPEGQVSTGRPSLLGLRTGSVTVSVSAAGYTPASGSVPVLAP